MYIDIGISLDGGWFLLGILPTRVIQPKSGESTKNGWARAVFCHQESLEFIEANIRIPM
jgi:hypothetical protein